MDGLGEAAMKSAVEPSRLKDLCIDAVTLDVGGTLIRPWPSVGAVYAECARACGLPDVPEDVLDIRFQEAWKNSGNFTYTTKEWKAIVLQCFQSFCPMEKEEDLFHAAYHAFAEPQAWSIFPDVLPTLRSLRNRGFRMAIVSNWDERLPQLLEKMGLAAYFHCLVVSGLENRHKPDGRLFEAACSRLGVKPERALHVGDHPIEDLQGCHSIGMHGLLIQRHPGKPSPAALQDLHPLSELNKQQKGH